MNSATLRHTLIRSYVLSAIAGSIIAVVVTYYTIFAPEVFPVVIISFLVFVLSAFLMQMAVGVFDINRLTLPGFWYLTYLAMIFFPAFAIFFDKVGPYRYIFLFAVESTIIAVPVGVIFANLLFGFKKSEIENYPKNPVFREGSNARHIFYFELALLIAIGIVIMYVLEAKTIPLFSILRHRGDFLGLAFLREESMKLMDSPFRFIYHILRDFAYPLLIIISLGYYLHYRRRRWLFLFVIALLSGLIYSAFSLARLPVTAIFFLIFLFLYMHYKKIAKKILVLMLFLMVSFPAIVMIAGQAEVDIPLVLWKIGERIFLAPANILYYYYEVVPESVDFLYGRTMGKLAFLTGQEYFDISNYVSQHINPSGLIETGSANAAYIGALYADFGIIGMLCGGILIGIIMQSINIYLLRKERTVFNMASYTVLVYEFGLLNILPLTSVLVFSGVPFLLIVLCLNRQNKYERTI